MSNDCSIAWVADISTALMMRVYIIVRENVWSKAKKRKKSRFLDFEKKNVKNVKNVTVVTCRPILFQA